MNYIQLGDVIATAKVNRCGENDFPVLSITKSDGIVLQSEKFKKRIASKDTADYKVVHRGQLVQGIHIDEANFGIQEVVDIGIVSPAYKIWNIKSNIIVPKYLEIVLRSPRSIAYYASKFNGSIKRRERLSDKDFLQMRIPCPAVEEQIYAIEVLNKAAELIGQRRQQLIELDNLIKARFVEMFGGYSEATKLSEVASVTGGLTKNTKRDKLPLRMPYLRVANVAFASIDVSEMLDIGLTEEECEKTLLQPEDLLFVEGNGSPDQIGRVAIWKNEIVPCVHQNHLIKSRFNKSKVLPVFAMYYFMSQQGREQIKSKAVSTSGLYTLSVSKVATLLLPTPPMELQEQFAAFVEQVDKSKVVVQKALDEAQTLFDSLMQEYFG